jgi:uncharacterized protein involved in exopolysaccharide biosynthesis
LSDDTRSSPSSTPQPVRHDRRPDGDEDEDASVVDRYIWAIRRRWLLIAAGAVIGGIVGFSVASRQPLRYQGTTTLLVVPPSQPGGAPINPATFRAIVENATLAAQVIDELKLEDVYTPLRFVERALTVDEVRGTSIVKVNVTLDDPTTAAEASRRLARKAIALTQQISQQDGASIQAQLKDHLNDAHRRLQAAEKELLTYKQTAQVELLERDTDAQLEERDDLLRLVVNIEAERARLEAALAEIKRQQPLLSAARMPDAEAALRRAAAAAAVAEQKREPVRNPDADRKGEADRKGDTDPRRETDRKGETGREGEVDSQHLDLSNPYVNPVYQTLDFQIATTRTRIAALERERDELLNVRKIGGRELSQLSELYRRQIEQERLQANFDLATRVYDDLALRYEQSRTQPFGSTAQLQVIDEALPPDRPVARRRLQSAAFGGALGLAGLVLVVLLWETLARRT